MNYHVTMLAEAFAVANLLTLAALLHRRYYRTFPWFCAALGAICWQALVSVVLPSTSPLNRYLWAPGEMLSMALLAVAITHATWRSITQRRLSRARSWVMMAGVIAFAGGLVYDAAEISPGLDWYWEFLELRVWIFLGLAILAFSGFWLGLYGNPRWPRAARMHTAMLAAATASHALFGGMIHWHSNFVNFRLLQMACCGGWLINSRFLVAERAEEVRRFPDAVPRRLWPAHPSAPLARQSAFQGD